MSVWPWFAMKVTAVRKAGAAAGAAAFLVVAPGSVAGLAPFLLTGWHAGAGPYPLALRIAGIALLTAGAAVLIYSFVRFVIEGLGTPAPIAAPATLVVGGLYRYVRNPMYLAVLAVIIGEEMLLSRPILLGYGAGVAAMFVAFVHWYEEPALLGKFGSQYEAYRRDVPPWWPRVSRHLGRGGARPGLPARLPRRSA